MRSRASLQWGRDLSAAESDASQRTAVADDASFNGAATFQPRKATQRDTRYSGTATLQWGRDLSVAESSAAGRPCVRRRRCFNGAATFQSRKGRAVDRACTSRTRFNGAATFQSRKAVTDRRHACQDPRQLQWGRDLSVAESSAAIGIVRRAASMGPRPFSRGKSGDPRPAGDPARFNGAATFQPRKARQCVWQARSVRACFNGAATFQSRKAGRRLRHTLPAPASMGPRPFSRGKDAIGRAIAAASLTLQWGRDLSAAERPCRPSGPAAHTVASMGPRPFSRGKVARECHRRRGDLLQWGRDLSAAESVAGDGETARRSGFNGAATFQPRKAACRGAMLSCTAASMGPRPFSRGKRPRSDGRRHARGFNGAATFQPRKARDRAAYQRSSRASMGPRPFSRGKTERSRRCASGDRASMGPRPFSRGKLESRRIASADVATGFNGAATFQPRKGYRSQCTATQLTQLQWGRDLSAAESSGTQSVDVDRIDVLQWGRDFSAAESRGGRAVTSTDASMGPRLQPRKARSTCGSRRSFNGAATFQPRKAESLASSVRASMGPRPFSRGKLARWAPASARSLQWGRDFSAAESSSSQVVSAQCRRTYFASGARRLSTVTAI